MDANLVNENVNVNEYLGKEKLAFFKDNGYRQTLVLDIIDSHRCMPNMK